MKLYLWIKHMQCASTFACPLNVEGIGGFKKGDKGMASCLPCSCKPAKQNSSPLVSLLDKRVFKFKVCIFKREICHFVNFKIPFTRKNWLLKFGFAYRLAQILEPKLLLNLLDAYLIQQSYFANFKILFTRLSNLLNLGLITIRH